MIQIDPANQRLRVIPVTVILIGVALAAALGLSLAGVIDLRRTGRQEYTHLFLGIAAVVCLVVTVVQWRTAKRSGNQIVVKSRVSSKRFSVPGVNVFSERHQVTTGRGLTRRKKDVWQVGLEQGGRRVVLERCGSSSAAQAVASKIRNALGLGLHDRWG